MSQQSFFDRAALRRFCAALLASAAIFRIGLFACTQTAQAAEFYFEPPVQTRAETRPAPELPEPTAYPTLIYDPPAAVPRFTAADADRVDIYNMYPNTLLFDKAAVITRTLNFDARKSGPLILIVHTHSCEAYTPSPTDDYTQVEPYRSTDPDTGVMRVGQALCDRLNAAGLSALHDTTLHDCPEYNGAYGRAAETIRSYLRRYPSIQMVIDLHRDAAEDSRGRQVALRTTVDGEQTAKLMFVVGSDLGENDHPGWLDNFACAMQLQALGEARAPGLFRHISMRRSSYNQELTPNSLLVEVGAIGNSLDEALRSAELLAELLTELLAGQTGRAD